MTKKTYICNVCRDEFSEPQAIGRIIGFNFKGGGGAKGSTATSWEPAPLHQCENHICTGCLDNATKFELKLNGRTIGH